MLIMDPAVRVKPPNDSRSQAYTMQKSTKILSLLLLLLIVIISYVVFAYYQFISLPLILANKPVTYILSPGTSIKKFASDLERLGIINKKYRLIVYIYLKGATKKLQAGEYQFLPGTFPKQFLDMVVNGRVLMHQLTLIEGWNFNQFLTAINNDSHLKHTLLGLTPDQIMSKLTKNGQHPEGLFFPDTYKFPLNTPDIIILQKAYHTMNKHLATEWANRTGNLLYKNSYEALIVASMIEKETAKSEERPMIAGLILRRLQKNMLLQIDPAVIHGVIGFL